MEISAPPEAFVPRTKYVALIDGTFVLVSGHSSWLHSTILTLLRHGTPCPVASAGFCSLSPDGKVHTFGESATLGTSSTAAAGVAISRVIQRRHAMQVYLPDAYPGGLGSACWLLTCGNSLALAIRSQLDAYRDTAGTSDVSQKDIRFEPIPVDLFTRTEVLARYHESTPHWL